MTQEQIDKIIIECNSEEDTLVFKYLDELRARLGQSK